MRPPGAGSDQAAKGKAGQGRPQLHGESRKRGREREGMCKPCPTFEKIVKMYMTLNTDPTLKPDCLGNFSDKMVNVLKT